MPVRQATRTAVEDRVEDRAADKAKKPKRDRVRGKSAAPTPIRPLLPQEPDFPTLVQALLEFTDPDPPPAPGPNPDPASLSSSISHPPETLSSPVVPSSVPHAGTPHANQAPSHPTDDTAPDESIQASSDVDIVGVIREENAGVRENGASASGIDYHHDSEAEFGRLLDYYGIEWQYEPHQFPLQWRDGRPIEMFTPDFYLPEYDLYIELTTMRQSLVRRKNRKLRLLRALYPEINIKLLYRRDYHRLLQRFGIAPEDLDAELEHIRQQVSNS
ncbi:MAG TPA: hypothetical protein VJ183_10640 [Chloroflexia bacterium]|nr:hypothetical protein [Chloroflexia bacterium]